MLSIRNQIKTATKDFLTQQFKSPTEDFAQFILSSIIEEEAGSQQYIDSVKQALKEFLNEPPPAKPEVYIRRPGNKTFIVDGKEYKFNSYQACLSQYLEILFDRHGEQFEEILDRDFGQQKPYFSKNPKELNAPWAIREDIDIYVKCPFNPGRIYKIIEILANHFGHTKPTIKLPN